LNKCEIGTVVLYCMCVHFGVFWSLSCVFCSMGSLFSVLFISLSGHYCDFNEKNVKLVLPFFNWENRDFSILMRDIPFALSLRFSAFYFMEVLVS